MILVIFPINIKAIDNHTLDNFDASNKEDAKEIFIRLLSVFGSDLSVYDLDKFSSNFLDVGKLVYDLNGGNSAIIDSWYIALNLTEKEVLCLYTEYVHNFVIIQENGEPLTYGETKELCVYCGYESAKADCKDGDKIYCLYTEKKNRKGFDYYYTHIFEMGQGMKEIGGFATDKNQSNWAIIAYNTLEDLFPTNKYVVVDVTNDTETEYKTFSEAKEAVYKVVLGIVSQYENKENLELIIIESNAKVWYNDKKIRELDIKYIKKEKK